MVNKAKETFNACAAVLQRYAAVQATVPLRVFLDHRLYQWHELIAQTLTLTAATSKAVDFTSVEEIIGKLKLRQHNFTSSVTHPVVLNDLKQVV